MEQFEKTSETNSGYVFDGMVKIIETNIRANGYYAEKLLIQESGFISRDKRGNDSIPPWLITRFDNEGEVMPEDIYKYFHGLQRLHPEYDIQFDRDKENKWIEYRITRRQQ